MGDAITATSDNSGGTFSAKVMAAATTNATVVKAGPGLLYGWALADATVAAAQKCYLKFYDKATAPTVGTDIPVFIVPLVSTTTYSSIADYFNPVGIRFVNGISYAITALPADADSTAVILNQCDGVILWR